MRLFIKEVVGGVFLLVLLSCSRLEKAKSMMTADEFRLKVEKDITSFADVAVLFPKTVDEVKRYIDFALKNSQKDLDQLLSVPKELRTYDNTVRAFDGIRKNIVIVQDIISTLEMVHPQKDMRDACHDGSLKMQHYSVDAYLKKELYQAFKDYEAGSLNKEKLSDEARYFFAEAIRDFERDGLHLSQDKLEEVKRIKKEIAEITLNFEANIAKDKSFIAVEKPELDGVNPSFIQALKKDAAGKYIVRCDKPSYIEVMDHCACEPTRKKLFFAYYNRAYPHNEKLLMQLVEKRRDLSQSLGFADFASLNIDDTMAKSPERVEAFLLDLHGRSTKKVHDEITMLSQDLPDGIKLDDNGRFDAWSLSYVKNYYKKKYLKIDEHEIAEYFPVEKALAGVFDVYQAFLGVKFTITKPAWAWHDEVRLIQVNDTLGGKLLGYLFLDLHPRDDKYSHACMGGFVPTVKKLSTGDKTPSVAIIIANFPHSTKNKPSLLKQDDVSTFFHEFGHAMHNLLGSTELAVFSGSAVKSDFVETPSQMFEEWLYDPVVLKKVSSHYKTGQPLPGDLINKMLKLKQFDSGMFVMRQVSIALYALRLHKGNSLHHPGALWNEIMDKYSPFVRNEPETHFHASFGHIASDRYAAKYYNYLWAKVFALDVFYKVKEKGLLSAEAGRELIDKMLGMGGSVDPNILLKDYLGREPNSDAFLKDLGIV